MSIIRYGTTHDGRRPVALSKTLAASQGYDDSASRLRSESTDRSKSRSASAEAANPIRLSTGSAARPPPAPPAVEPERGTIAIGAQAVHRPVERARRRAQRAVQAGGAEHPQHDRVAGGARQRLGRDVVDLPHRHRRHLGHDAPFGRGDRGRVERRAPDLLLEQIPYPLALVVDHRRAGHHRIAAGAGLAVAVERHREAVRRLHPPAADREVPDPAADRLPQVHVVARAADDIEVVSGHRVVERHPARGVHPEVPRAPLQILAQLLAGDAHRPQRVLVGVEAEDVPAADRVGGESRAKVEGRAGGELRARPPALRLQHPIQDRRRPRARAAWPASAPAPSRAARPSTRAPSRDSARDAARAARTASRPGWEREPTASATLPSGPACGRTMSTCTTATAAAYGRGCTNRTPPIVESRISPCECPTTTTSGRTGSEAKIPAACSAPTPAVS